MDSATIIAFIIVFLEIIVSIILFAGVLYFVINFTARLFGKGDIISLKNKKVFSTVFLIAFIVMLGLMFISNPQ